MEPSVDGRLRSVAGCDGMQRFAIEAHHLDLQTAGVQASIEPERRIVGAQYPPLQPAVAPRSRARQVGEQGQADPYAAVFGAHVQVLKVHAGAASNGAVARVVQSEADRLTFQGRQHRLSHRVLAERRASEVARLGRDLAGNCSTAASSTMNRCSMSTSSGWTGRIRKGCSSLRTFVQREPA